MVSLTVDSGSVSHGVSNTCFVNCILSFGHSCYCRVNYTVCHLYLSVMSPFPVTVMCHPRRFREFVALDEKLQQFYGSLRATLPPRKTVGNMNKEFLEKRRVQLEKYLMVGPDVFTV